MTLIRGAIPLVAGFLAIATATPSQALTYDEVAKLSGPDRQKILEEGAKKEGEVSWYTSLTVDQVVRPIVEAFNKKYPDIKLNFVRADTGDLMQKILAESRAKSIRVDVVAADIAAPLKNSGLAQPFNTPIMAEYPKNYIDADHSWVSIRSSWQGIGWNTRLVSEADAPKTWEDLLNPKWKGGKLVWGSSPDTGAPRLIAHLLKTWGDDKTMDYLKKLKTQDVRTAPGSIRTVLDQVIAGEYSIGLSMAMHHIAISRSQGAPVYGVSPEPVLGRSGVICFVKGAPHPYAGMIFLDFMMDKDGGQKVFAASQYNPAHPAVKPLPELDWIMPSRSGKTEYLMPPDEEEEMTKKANEVYKQIFR
jgi:ABC-type Fe3+ transport system substrate-binding protein